ncbi:MAG: ATP synthase F1 subunit delta, partial [Clostridiales Family XIII bacterium]|nr:ATP synthase F1 subunit delta [Clostridiales Family XIII bacterium]
MEALTVATTYGAALFEVARDLDKIDSIGEEITALGGIFKDEPEFFNLLCNPGIDAVGKKETLKTVLDGRVSKELLNFMFILTDKRRIGGFHTIVKAYHTLVNANLGISIGSIYSAVPLSDDRRKSLEEETGKLLKRNVRLDNLIDADLIGGVKIYIEGKLIDASIR